MKLLHRLLVGITDENVCKRIGWMYATFFGIYLSALVASYFLLPEGCLRGRHPIISRLQFSSDFFTLTLQIFGYNMIPTGLIIAANLLAQQSKIARETFVPIGYTAFWAISLLFAVTAGTWSFAVVVAAPPLEERLLRVFDVLHHAGLLEMSAYILAAATSYRFTIWYSDGRRIVRSRRWQEIRLLGSEKAFLILAFVLLFWAALIESRSILRLAG